MDGETRIYSPYKMVWRIVITSCPKELIDSLAQVINVLSRVIYYLIFPKLHVTFKRR